jgi:hypothetical protein
LRGSWQIAFWEGGARWSADVVGADADSEQTAGDLFSAGARGAGEVLGPVVAADRGDENGEDDDCRDGKKTATAVSVIANVMASRTGRVTFFRSWRMPPGSLLRLISSWQ